MLGHRPVHRAVPVLSTVNVGAAAVIMETRSAMFLCRLSVLLASVCLCVLLQVSCDVFLDSPSANQLLARRRRANSPFEEWRQGDMERECVEERCDREEAREIFENEELTNEFWNKYYDGDACVSNPCAHSGVCKDGIGQYTCFCPVGYQGYNCEIVIPELCENKNGGCDHFCDVTGGNVRCSCADGYYLETDEKSCNSNQTYKCGAVFAKGTRTVFHYVRPNATAADGGGANATEQSDVPAVFDVSQFTEPSESSWPAEGADDYMMDEGTQLVEEELHLADVSAQTRIVGGEQCPPGDCPWQALLMNEEKRGFCGGTILTDYIILTAAHCINQSRYIYVVLGEFDIEVNEGRESKHNVERVLMHRQYKPDTFHNDIALIKLTTPVKFTKFIIPACLPEKDFAEKVLMREPDGLVSGWGRIGEGRAPSAILQRLTMPYVDRAVCMESSQFRISARMFCAGYADLKKDACQGDSGGPHVTRYKNTYFVTGVVSWGEGCAREGKFGVYTQISKYIGWLKNGIARLTPRPHPNEGASQGTRKRRDTAPFPIIRM